MDCPICKKGSLDENDGEFVCDGPCGAAFTLEFQGYYEEGAGPEDRIEGGPELAKWCKKWKFKEIF